MSSRLIFKPYAGSFAKGEVWTASRKPVLMWSMISSTYWRPLIRLQRIQFSSTATAPFASSVGQPNSLSLFVHSSLLCMSEILSDFIASITSSDSRSIVIQSLLCLLGLLPMIAGPL